MGRRHLVEALLAFQNVLEAYQRLASLMASRTALVPFLNCIEPACRYGTFQEAFHQQAWSFDLVWAQ